MYAGDSLLRKGRNMGKAIKPLLWLAAVCAILFFVPASAAAQDDPRGSEGFYITGYDVNAVISEDNVYDVTETIGVHYTEKKHGIIRVIPVNTEMKRIGRESTKVSSRVWDVSVAGYDYSVEYDSKEVDIKIGSADRYVSGDKTYVIKYKIGFGDDGLPEVDEVYYNIIGVDWPCTIDDVTFSVTLPKEFDSSKLGFSTGAYSKIGYDERLLDIGVSGNTITGRFSGRLGAYEGITMRLELPQGYFKVPDPKMADWILMGLMGAVALISILLMLAYGRDKKPVVTVEFYPPEDMTPSEVGYIIDGSVDDRDIVSLIIYWADKGYLSIADKGRNVFELTKLKEPGPEAKPFEKTMFDGLFRKGGRVDTNDLRYSFYHTYNVTKTMVQMSFESQERRIFTKSSTRLMPFISFLTSLPFMMAIVLSIYRGADVEFIFALFLGVMFGIGLLLPTFMLIGLLRRWRGESKRAGKLIWRLILWAFLTGGAMIISADKAYEPLLPWAALASTVITGICAVFIRKRTDKGIEWLGKIYGLRNFITAAEKDRINLLVQDNPSYFYRILPFAYVLGVTDKWAKNFESITVSPPEWYYGQGTFTPVLFMASMNSAMNSFRTQMVSTPPSRSGGGGFSGGGFSGGGFSGGGGGGGGGHSW